MGGRVVGADRDGDDPAVGVLARDVVEALLPRPDVRAVVAPEGHDHRGRARGILEGGLAAVRGGQPEAGGGVADRQAHTGTPAPPAQRGDDVVEVGEGADPASRSRVGAAGVGRGRGPGPRAVRVAPCREVGRRAGEAEARGVLVRDHLDDLEVELDPARRGRLAQQLEALLAAGRRG